MGYSKNSTEGRYIYMLSFPCQVAALSKNAAIHLFKKWNNPSLFWFLFREGGKIQSPLFGHFRSWCLLLIAMIILALCFVIMCHSLEQQPMISIAFRGSRSMEAGIRAISEPAKGVTEPFKGVGAPLTNLGE